jgi:5-methylcytosine-specific restriction endonuclease McrA
MKKHTMTYFNHFGYDISSFIDCEVCGKVGNDLHHIEARGMGGSKHADVIENLMCLCRECHIKYGDKKQYKDFLKCKHAERISSGKNSV